MRQFLDNIRKGKQHKPNGLVAFLGSLKKTNNILDVGFGAGMDSIYLCNKGHRVVALEKNLNNVKKLKGKVAELPLKVLQSDIFSYVPHNKFDVVLVKHIDHFYNKQNFMVMIEKIQALSTKKSINAYSLINPSKSRIKMLCKMYNNSTIKYFDIDIVRISDGSLVTVVNYAFKYKT